MAVLTTPGLPEGYKPGLEGVVAGVSQISDVDPVHDALIFRGYPAHELAEKASYDEVAYLLLYGKLPTKAELSSYREEMLRERVLPPAVLSVLKQLPKSPHMMVTLELAVSLLAMFDADAQKNTLEADLAKAKRLIAKAPTVVAALYRLSKGQDPLPPNPKLDHPTNFIYMVTGKEPDAEVGRIFGSSMIMYAEHGYNASTFAALVTASTLSDMHSSIVSAIGALKGSLHGGANERAIEMLLEIGDESKADAWLKDALGRKEKVMGFGHRVYKKQDSRAPYMKKMAQRMAEKVGDKKLFPLSLKVEEAMKREKNIFPNVDYHGAVVYYLMGLPVEIYTPIFAIARMAGWTAHIVEQHASNRLIRPECFYNGPRDLKFVPVDER